MTSPFSVVYNIAQDEWRYWVRSKLAITVLVIGMLLTIASVIVTGVSMVEQSHQRQALQSQSEARFMEQPDRHPHRMVHYGHYAFRVPSPLSMLDPGVDAYTGNTISLEGHRQNSAMFADQKQGTGLTKLGGLSPAFIAQTLAPLLLILIGYSSVSREHESHTLSFIMSQGTSVFTVIAGKGLALLAVVALIILPLAISGVYAAYNGESSTVVVSFLFAYSVYLFVWVLIILLVSVLAKKTSISFTALSFVWIALCIALPRIASSTASSVSSAGKLETDFEVIAQLRKLGDGHNANDKAFEQLKASLLAEYKVDTVDELPINFRGAVARASEAELSEVLNRFAEARMQQELEQTHVMRSFGWLSPMIAIRTVSMISAGTSIETHHRFLREAEQLRFNFVQALNQVHVEQLDYQDDLNRNNGEAGNQKARVTADNWQIIDDFAFVAEPASTRLQRSAHGYVQILIWVCLLLAAINVAGRRA